MEEFELAVAKEFEAFGIHGFAVIFWIVDVVGAGAHFGDGAFGAGLEFAVLKDSEGNAGVGQVGEVNADATLDGFWIDGVGEVPGLLALDHVDVFGGVEISAAGAGGRGGFDAFFSPKIGLADVVVIGNRDGGPISHDIAELHAEFKPT